MLSKKLVNKLAMTPIGIRLRPALRLFGFTSYLSRLIYSAQYEDEFRNVLIPMLQEGDVVWDVGANIGTYSKLFLNQVGPEGRVVAFEPNPTACATLLTDLGSCAAFRLFPIALGAVESSANLVINEGDDTDPTGSLMRPVSNHRLVPVEIKTGASVLSDYLELRPDVIKIDVEGFELEVLRGLVDLLVEFPPRIVAIEVHVGILQSEKVVDPVRHIKDILSTHDYHFHCPDASHIIAERCKRDV